MQSSPRSNGAALAAVAAAGIGSLTLGLIVIANEAGLYTAPSLYPPAGGLSGRSTFAVLAWLIAWVILHRRWRNQDLIAGRVLGWTLTMVAVGLVLSFPPVWGLF